jgi:hypothetical protein
MSRLLGHLTFVSIAAALWIWFGCQSTGIISSVAVVLGSMHLGVVAYKCWPIA